MPFEFDDTEIYPIDPEEEGEEEVEPPLIEE